MAQSRKVHRGLFLDLGNQRLIELTFTEAIASQPSSPVNLSSDVISPAGGALQPTTAVGGGGGHNPVRHTSPAAPAGHVPPSGQTGSAASVTNSTSAAGGLSTGGSGGGGSSSGGGLPSGAPGTAAYNQQEVRYSGTELVMLYDYKVSVDCRN
jgi:uncharacterized membrane protein YgcG